MLPKARLLRSHMRNARLRLRKSGKLDRIKPIANHRWRIVRGDKVAVAIEGLAPLSFEIV